MINRCQKSNRAIKQTVVILLLLLTVLFGVLFTMPKLSIVRADEAVYSDVLEDLKQDPDFDESKYPTVFGGTKIEVVQIAESSDNELFVYVYLESDFHRSGGDLRPKQIRISTDPDEANARWHDYDLIELSSSSTLKKYIVDGLIVSDEPERLYRITCLFRDYISAMDYEQGDDSLTVTQTAIPVAQYWTAKTIDTQLHYRMEYDEVIEITDLYTATVRYDSRHIGWSYKDRHFIAFSTDKQIDTLLEADISYSEQIEWLLVQGTATARRWTDPEATELTVQHDEEHTVETGFFNKKIYVWDSIQKPDAFLTGLDNIYVFSPGESRPAQTDTIKQYQWVISFLLTDYIPSTQLVGKPNGTHIATLVSDVSVLRLKFITEGDTYNLGAVSKKATGDDVWHEFGPGSSNKDTPWDKFLSWVKKIMSKIFGWDASTIPDWGAVLFLVGVVVVCGLLLALLSPFLPLIGHALVALFKGLWWLISAPVRFVISLFHKGDE